MLPRDQQEVDRCLRVDVAERDDRSDAWTMCAGASRAAIRQKRQVLESAATTAAIYPVPPTGNEQACSLWSDQR